MIYKKNKKAVSVMIGYVLLVAFAVVMGGLIFNWMKSYVPKDPLDCPDGVSMFIQDIDCKLTPSESNYAYLNLTLKNNGRFNIAGYFIKGTEDHEQVATIDLSNNLSGGIILGSAILFSKGNENALKPGEKRKSVFNLSDEIVFIEIIPIRFEIVENKKRMISCGNAKINEVVECVGGGESFETVSFGYFGFEDGEQGWSVSAPNSDRSEIRSAVNNDGTDVGTWSLYIQDGTSESVISQSFDFMGYDSVTISWEGYYEGFEEGDCVNIVINNFEEGNFGIGGCGENVVAYTWISQGIVITNSEYDFNSLVEVKFVGDMDETSDNFYIDGINIIGRS